MSEVWKEWLGQVVDGRFPLGQYLCGSDQGAVFATRPSNGEPRKAAIKLVPADSANAMALFLRWQSAQKLSHPNLIKIFQTGQWARNDRTIFYTVMELGDEDLSQVLPQRRLTAQEARDVLVPMLHALAYLHERQIVHGHLKPSNIFAIGDQLKISSDGLNVIGDLVQSPSTPSIYLAPEVDNQGLSPASDLWAAGVVLVEALTQKPPVWDDKTQAPQVPATLPQPFREIAENCLHLDPQRRWSLRQVNAFLNPSPEAVRQPEPKAKVPAPPPAKVSLPAVPKVSAAPAPKRRFAIPVTVGALVIIAILIAAKFTGRSSQGTSQNTAHQALPAQPSSPEPSTASAPSDVQASPASSAIVPASSTSKSGEVLKQIVPDVPRSARNTIHGTVRVSVLASVDPAGNVSSARFEKHGPSDYFANMAMKAAKDWKFKPPQVNGSEVASNWMLHFDFKRSGTNVHPTLRNP